MGSDEFFPVDSSGSATPDNCKLIMIVEDDLWVRESLSDVLQSFNYRTVLAENAEEALAKIQEFGESIMLVLCDMVLPNMNGRDLSRKLADERNDLKILFMSGYPVELLAVRGIDVAGISVLSKPLLPKELVAAIRSELHGGKNAEASF